MDQVTIRSESNTGFMRSLEDIQEVAYERYMKRRVFWCEQEFLRSSGEERESTIGMSLSLCPPFEGDVIEDWAALSSWVKQWEGIPAVTWETRTFPGAGRWSVPLKFVADSRSDLKPLLGDLLDDPANLEFERRVDRYFSQFDFLRMESEQRRNFVQALHSHQRELISGSTKKSWGRAFNAIIWLAENPESGLFPAQLPLPESTTKFLQPRGLYRAIEALVTAITGKPDLGLRWPSAMVPLRVLDPQLQPAFTGQMSYAQAPVHDVQHWGGSEITQVVLVENLQALLSLPDMDKTLAIQVTGFSGVGPLAEIPWLHDVPVVYWGDIDVAGLQILSQVRQILPHVKSALMDIETARSQRRFAAGSADPLPHANLNHLTEAEQEVVSWIRENNIASMEQERIPTDVVRAALHEAFEEAEEDGEPAGG